MEGGTGVTLFEPDLKLNIINCQEDDEEAIEEQKRRDQALEAQVANAFDDWSDDEDGKENRSESSCSNHSNGGSQSNSRSNSHNRSNGMIFHNLSDISEHSPSKSYQSSEMSRTSEDGKKIGNIFSPSRSISNKFIHVNGNTPMSGCGDGGNFNPIFKNNRMSGDFNPILLNNGSHHSIDDSIDAYQQADMNSEKQLQILYEMRMKEIQRLTNQLESERADAAAYKQDMFNRLNLMEADKERALLSYNNATKLLVDSKEEIEKLQKEAYSLKQKISALEKEKEKNDELAEVSKVQIDQLEQRIAMMERCDANKNFVKQADIMVKELKTKHQQEILQMQRQVESLNKKLIKKDEDCRELEQKVLNLQKMHEELLVEKSETINHLARNLEESQARCQQLMASNVSVDNVRLTTQLEDALRDKEELNRTVKELQSRCSLMQSDLAQFETMSRLTLQGNSSSDETDSIIQLGLSSQPEKRSRTNRNQSDINASLKDELRRSLLNQNAKRAEIRRLQETLQERETKIQEMTKQERIFIAQNETLSEQLQKVMQEFSSHQITLESKDTNDKVEEIASCNADLAELRKKCIVLEREKLEIQEKLDNLVKHFEVKKKEDISEYKKECLKLHDDTILKIRKEVEEETELKIKEYSLRLEHSLREVTEVKGLYVSVCEAKEQLAQSLELVKSELLQVTAERDRLSKELQQCNAVRDQLIRSLNESAANKSDDKHNLSLATQQLTEERDRLQAELDRCLEMRDQLARSVNVANRKNNELNEEINRLKGNLDGNSLQHEAECAKCEQLKEELSAMSARLTQELTAARSELHAARDRVIQLERSTRLQYETDMKTLKQDCDMWKTKCDEKEVQIKKLIESRKRSPMTVSVATETEGTSHVDASGQLMERERHERELARCREEYNNALAAMEKASHDRHRLELDKLQERTMMLMETAKGEWEKQRQQEVAAVEERTKQLTVQYFAEEFRKMEARYKERLSQLEDSTRLESLQRALMDRTKEVEDLQQRLAAVGKEFGERMLIMQRQLDSDRDTAAQLMVQWAQEVKNMQGELKLKEALIDDQRSKMEEAEASKKKYRDKLLKTNREITAQYLSKCAEYKAKMQETIEESEKAVFEKIKQLESVYEAREKELKKKISKKQQIS